MQHLLLNEKRRIVCSIKVPLTNLLPDQEEGMKNCLPAKARRQLLSCHSDSDKSRSDNNDWYTGRDSNPQPSEPESDALSIEPPVHLFYSLNIIAGFLPFVKGQMEKFLDIILQI